MQPSWPSADNNTRQEDEEISGAASTSSSGTCRCAQCLHSATRAWAGRGSRRQRRHAPPVHTRGRDGQLVSRHRRQTWIHGGVTVRTPGDVWRAQNRCGGVPTWQVAAAARDGRSAERRALLQSLGVDAMQRGVMNRDWLKRHPDSMNVQRYNR